MFLGQRSKINSSAYSTNIPCNDQKDIKVVISSYFKAGTTGFYTRTDCSTHKGPFSKFWQVRLCWKF